MIQLQANSNETPVDVKPGEIGAWLASTPELAKKFDRYQKTYVWLMDAKVPFVFDKEKPDSFLASLQNCAASLDRWGKRKAFCISKENWKHPFVSNIQNLDLWEGWETQKLLERCRNIQYALRDLDLIAAVLHDIDALLAADIKTKKTRNYREWYETFLHYLLRDAFKPHVIWEEGVLKENDFFALLGGLTLPLDAGADHDFYTSQPANRAAKKHGAFSHVFQWLIIQEALTHPERGNPANAKCYNDLRAYEPAALLTEIAKITYSVHQSFPQKNPIALWNILFDWQPYDRWGIQYDATMPEGITTFVEAKEENEDPLFTYILSMEFSIEGAYTMYLSASEEVIVNSEAFVTRPYKG